MPKLILWSGLALIAWLLHRDSKTRPGVSATTWLPTLWVMVLSSRPISTWFSPGDAFHGSSEYSLEGSPLDRNGFLLLILGSFIVVQRRRVPWNEILQANKGIIVFYAYFAVSVLWASSPFVSLKRWIKDFGNIFVALVILSESNPQEAFRAVFVRCSYVLIPLSVITLRWFPAIGRSYNRHSGAMEAIGLTFQKNSLGAMVLVTGLIVIWDILHRLRQRSWRRQKLDLTSRLGVLTLGGYLLYISDSKTATVGLILGSAIIASRGLAVVRRNAARFMVYGSVAAIVMFAADQQFGITEWVVGSLGRDMTFTGRTAIWQVLLGLGTDPIFGSGFRDLWSNMPLVNTLPDYISAGRSAHNGYLEIYLDGGLVGVGFMVVMLLSVGHNMHRFMGTGGEYGFLRVAVLVVAIIYNFSESHFGRLSPVWFLFLLSGIDYGRVQLLRIRSPQSSPASRVARSATAKRPEPVQGSMA